MVLFRNQAIGHSSATSHNFSGQQTWWNIRLHWLRCVQTPIQIIVAPVGIWQVLVSGIITELADVFLNFHQQYRHSRRCVIKVAET